MEGMKDEAVGEVVDSRIEDGTADEPDLRTGVPQQQEGAVEKKGIVLEQDIQTVVPHRPHQDHQLPPSPQIHP